MKTFTPTSEKKLNTIKDHEDVIKQIRKAIDSPQHVRLPDNKQYLMDSGTASLIIQVVNITKNNERTKDKLNQLFMTSQGMMKLVSLVWKNATSCDCPKSGTNHHHENRKLNNEDRRGWILNDEGLYNWARRNGVRI